MEEDDPTCVARRRKVNHGGDNQARYCFPVFSCLRSARCNTICRTLSIVLLPGLILFGGITVFITGCLINIPPMIIGGAAMFVLGILFCLLCGHACDGLTKRVRKPRQSRDETKPVLVWFQLVWLFLSSLLDNWWHPLNGERVFQTQYLIRQWKTVRSVAIAVERRSTVQCFSDMWPRTHQLHSEVTLMHKSFK